MVDLTSYGKNHATGSLKTYLVGKKSLNWAISMIKYDIKGWGLQRQDLQDIFSQLEPHADKKRFLQAREKCHKEGML